MTVRGQNNISHIQKRREPIMSIILLWGKKTLSTLLLTYGALRFYQCVTAGQFLLTHNIILICRKLNADAGIKNKIDIP